MTAATGIYTYIVGGCAPGGRVPTYIHIGAGVVYHAGPMPSMDGGECEASEPRKWRTQQVK